MDSILLHTKNLLDIPEDSTEFDQAVLTSINTSIFTLAQLGLPVPANFVVTNLSQTWSDLLGALTLEPVKSFIYLRAKREFDPPASSFLIEAIGKQIDELVSRIFMEVDPILEV